jgi:hypothetical protein
VVLGGSCVEPGSDRELKPARPRLPDPGHDPQPADVLDHGDEPGIVPGVELPLFGFLRSGGSRERSEREEKERGSTA